MRIISMNSRAFTDCGAFAISQIGGMESAIIAG
jgi:hypothetical protein